MQTLSFAILDDFRFKHYQHTAFNTQQEAREIVFNNLDKIQYKEYQVGDEDKPNFYCYLYFRLDRSDYEDVFQQLWRQGYYVWNRVAKYYVICFAIDYRTFNVYAKDCDADRIDWTKTGSPNGPFVDNGIPKGYNRDPVLALMQALKLDT